MKKRSAILIVLCIIASLLDAQTNFDMYGVCLTSDPPKGGVAFTRIDPNTGNVTLQNKWNKKLNAFGAHTIDPKNKMFYQVTTDAWNMYIIKVDLNTGIILDTVFVQDSIGTGDTTVNWVSGEVNGLFYNCVDQHVYFFYNTPNKQLDNSLVAGTRLAKLDANTGKVSLVDVFPPALYGAAQRCSQNQQKIFIYSYYNSTQLIIYDLQTKQTSSVKLSRSYSAAQYATLVLHTGDGHLYGYEKSNSGKCRIVKVDPENGLITEISDFFDFFGMGSMCFDPTNSKLYFMGFAAGSGTMDLASFDIDTRKLAVHKITNNLGPTLFVGIHIVGNNQLDSDFTFKKGCQNTPVEFNPTTHNGPLEWNFGDPASGNLNTSHQLNPQHIYATPGTYTVKMTSGNCWQSVTTTKKLTINAFPEIDLGDDINWCLHKKNDEVYLQLNTTGVNYLWQDLTTADNYTIKKPGLYWVKVSDANCEVTDSVRVNELPCGCDITVSPTLTHATTSFIFDCELSTYAPMVLELYNERRQLTLRRNIIETETILNFEEFTAGMYFYRIQDKSSILKSGKIIFIR